MSPRLPETLRYLQPFRRKFARLKPESLNEDSGAPVLMPLLSKRIQGLDPDAAVVRLNQDRTALEQWLAHLGDQADPLHFAHGFLLTASPAELVGMIKEETEKPGAPTLHLHMDLPVGAKQRRVPGSDESEKLVTLKGIWLAVSALSKEVAESLANPTPTVRVQPNA